MATTPVPGDDIRAGDFNAVIDALNDFLASCGTSTIGPSSWTDLVDVTVYLTNMKQDFPVYNKIWAEYFSENPPCRTTVEVTALPTPIAIELKCIAVFKEV